MSHQKFLDTAEQISENIGVEWSELKQKIENTTQKGTYNNKDALLTRYIALSYALYSLSDQIDTLTDLSKEELERVNTLTETINKLQKKLTTVHGNDLTIYGSFPSKNKRTPSRKLNLIQLKNKAYKKVFFLNTIAPSGCALN